MGPAPAPQLGTATAAAGAARSASTHCGCSPPVLLRSTHPHLSPSPFPKPNHSAPGGAGSAAEAAATAPGGILSRRDPQHRNPALLCGSLPSPSTRNAAPRRRGQAPAPQAEVEATCSALCCAPSTSPLPPTPLNDSLRPCRERSASRQDPHRALHRWDTATHPAGRDNTCNFISSSTGNDSKSFRHETGTFSNTGSNGEPERPSGPQLDF